MNTTTVDQFGLTFELDFEYEAAEAPINHPSSAGNPGTPASATVVRILLVPEHPERDETRRDLTMMIESLGCLPQFDAIALATME